MFRLVLLGNSAVSPFPVEASKMVTTDGTQTLTNKTIKQSGNNVVGLYRNERIKHSSGVAYTIPTVSTVMSEPAFASYQVYANEVLEWSFDCTFQNNSDQTTRFLDARIYLDGVEQMNRVTSIVANPHVGSKEYMSIVVAGQKLYTVDTSVSITMSVHSAASGLQIPAGGDAALRVRCRASNPSDFTEESVQYA